MKRTARFVVFLACILFTVTAAYNVMSDNAEVEGMASNVACKKEGPTCKAQKTRMERTPFAQTFRFVTSKNAEFEVRCVRQFVLLGEYACELR